MRIVADINVVVSELLWTGGPRLLLDAARADVIELVTSPALLEELVDVLERPKFAALATVVEPTAIEPVVVADPDDDHVVACALAANADLIVSGDDHLLSVGEYRGIRIVAATQALIEIAGRSRTT